MQIPVSVFCHLVVMLLTQNQGTTVFHNVVVISDCPCTTQREWRGVCVCVGGGGSVDGPEDVVAFLLSGVSVMPDIITWK